MHRNDIENFLPFFVLGYLYSTNANPDYNEARIVFGVTNILTSV